MEESREIQKLHGFLQCAIYFSVALEAVLFVYLHAPFWGIFVHALARIKAIPVYDSLLYSKLLTFLLICLVSIGTLSRKDRDLKPKRQIISPLCTGLLLFFGSIFFCGRVSVIILPYTNWTDLVYMSCSLFGALLTSLAMDNVSKMIRSSFGKDKWNTERESFQQPQTKIDTKYSVCIPMLFYYKNRVRKGWINIVNPFRGTLLLGVPGSGKSYGIVNSFIRQMIAKEFCAVIYDFKYPDLGRIAYYHHLLAHKQGKCAGFSFHVVNLNEVEKSRRVNPWKAEYLRTLADASESAEGLVEAMKKGDRSSGSDQFFTQSAINFLSACIYFFSKYDAGKYSSFPHVLAFLNRSYEEIFNALFSMPELASLLSPFRSAYQQRAFPQLEGQVGTLKIFISRLATKESFWVFSGDDFNLKVSSKESPAILILANDPRTQSINSASYSVIVNRVTQLINTRGNHPVGLIIDEAPSLYTHKIEHLISQARSNLSAVLLGLQELPMLKQQYSRDTAETITSVVGNILSGAVRNKDTLEWLERLFGKSNQVAESLSIDRNKTSTSLSEKLEALIPAGKIASLGAGQMVGLLAPDADDFTGRFETAAVHCKVHLDRKAIAAEEAGYRELPVYYDFGDDKEQTLTQNFARIHSEVEAIVQQFT
ncbi:type IV secretory system conjugative DNA transfer family protein [Mucilaginibacter limnophilus]|uniref:Type IV secretory system conjugative DNA transfer family protein n=1 Tax=Mucilaginibacter limnophilus TaxID=1932778 RepID=A0A437MPZ3_9SPHI|nr:type IV secretion system DNA-binding domain-containing protein [Mucilaginibacter limnophilus]RVT99713.1 type IV secretory system conjugative DNA transfer family protein [Mucilaginibacter limnophilus]